MYKNRVDKYYENIQLKVKEIVSIANKYKMSIDETGQFNNLLNEDTEFKSYLQKQINLTMELLQKVNVDYDKFTRFFNKALKKNKGKLPETVRVANLINLGNTPNIAPAHRTQTKFNMNNLTGLFNSSKPSGTSTSLESAEDNDNNNALMNLAQSRLKESQIIKKLHTLQRQNDNNLLNLSERATVRSPNIFQKLTRRKPVQAKTTTKMQGINSISFDTNIIKENLDSIEKEKKRAERVASRLNLDFEDDDNNKNLKNNQSIKEKALESLKLIKTHIDIAKLKLENIEKQKPSQERIDMILKSKDKVAKDKLKLLRTISEKAVKAVEDLETLYKKTDNFTVTYLMNRPQYVGQTVSYTEV